MKVRILLACLVLVSVLPSARGVQKEYSTGKVVDVQERTRDRVLLYQVNTPIMTEDPYYVVSVEVRGEVFEAEHLPRDFRQPFPGFWKADDEISARVDKHFLYLKSSDGTEAKFLITSTSRLPAVRESH
jgi:hypothetical protein